MQDSLIKVYGWFDFGNEEKSQEKIDKNSSSNKYAQNCLNALHELCEAWYLETDIFTCENNMIHISFEGDYFPHEESAQILALYISEKTTGKLDVINIEEWTLERFFLDYEHNKELVGKKYQLENMKQEKNTAAAQVAIQISVKNESNKENEKIKTPLLLPYSRKSSLNHALEASQEKNGAGYLAP